MNDRLAFWLATAPAFILLGLVCLAVPFLLAAAYFGARFLLRSREAKVRRTVRDELTDNPGR